ncbi:AI-2E family transporter [Rhizobium sp. P44RR-XXIV]|uniref:AI-2E family transporter n=1 Tax=Rhizobium sp. P44RR-XXIV TaxID=1921145 RepID=UPI0009864CF0|nr:AI-2E family transporter [Rhizobium sp. P44RR-XXIV]TIX89786.1 AI-2E family transporter [Rhizobium sp. P44RR-XXIV]
MEIDKTAGSQPRGPAGREGGSSSGRNTPQGSGNDTAASELVDDPPQSQLQVAASWATIGIFLILALAGVYMMSIILIPVTLAVVVGMILGLAAEKLSKLGVPRILNAVLLSSAVALAIFLIINALAGPLAKLAQEAPDFFQRTSDRLMPYLDRFKWLHISPETFQSGPMSISTLLENSGNVLHVVSSNLTPAIVQILIFFAALLLFLASRITLRKTIIMAFSNRAARLTTIRIINAVEQVLGFYFATASLIYAGIGVAMTIIAYVGGLSVPVLWGVFAFVASFIPFLGVTTMTIALAIAGIITHSDIVIALAPAIVFFAVHLAVENLVFPAIMGRQWELNPFVVFFAIIFWTWMWGAVGAMLALPLSLIVMTVINELFIEEKVQPQLPG